jgi:hypothetical protein
MRLLKILIFVIFPILFSSRAFAQSEPSGFTPFQEDPPTFSIGFSLGFPSNYHASILDVAGVQGLRLRGDIGAFYFILGLYLQADLNVEYHFAPPREIGFYFGAGIAVFKLSVISEFPNPDNEFWRFGGQVYVGLEFGGVFLEFGLLQSFTGLSNGTGLLPRFTIGFNFYR